MEPYFLIWIHLGPGIGLGHTLARMSACTHSRTHTHTQHTQTTIHRSLIYSQFPKAQLINTNTHKMTSFLMKFREADLLYQQAQRTSGWGKRQELMTKAHDRSRTGNVSTWAAGRVAACPSGNCRAAVPTGAAQHRADAARMRTLGATETIEQQISCLLALAIKLFFSSGNLVSLTSIPIRQHSFGHWDSWHKVPFQSGQWCTPIAPALRRQGQEDQELKGHHSKAESSLNQAAIPHHSPQKCKFWGWELSLIPTLQKKKVTIPLYWRL